MRYVLTGVAGFIGSTIADKLLSRGHEVIGIDNFSTGQKRFIQDALNSTNFQFLDADVSTNGAWGKSFEGADAVVHFAANADVRGGLSNPSRDLQQNTLATFNVLEAMREQSVRRIIFASSAAALGEPTLIPTPESCPIPQQTSLYGASKMACEGLISAYCEGYGFEGYAFRFVSVLGVRYPHGHVFDFVKQLLVDPSTLRILGNGTQRKSYLNVADCAEAVVHVSEELRTAKDAKHRFEIYHLGHPSYCTINDSARWICNELGVDPKFEYTGGDRGWIGDNPFVFLDVSKAMATGWYPKYDIERSVKDTVSWLRSNQWIFEARV